MRSVFVHLRDTTKECVAAFLQQTYPFQQGPPWICDIGGDACLYLDFCSDVRKEFEPEDWRGLLAALGGEPQVSILADVSGRHPGGEQVHAFVLTLLAQFKGIAQDDYTWHCWTAEDIRSGRKVEGHSFFDYQRQPPTDLESTPPNTGAATIESPSYEEPDERRSLLKALALLAATLACVVAALFALHPSHDPTATQICVVVAIHTFLTFGLITQNTIEGLVMAVLLIILGCAFVSMNAPGTEWAKRWLVVATIGASWVASRRVRRYIDGLAWVE